MGEQPFLKLQKILDSQKTRPIRTSPAKRNGESKETSLILNRRKVENREVPGKKMFSEKENSQGRVWSEGRPQMGRPYKEDFRREDHKHAGEHQRGQGLLSRQQTVP
jgi:hypothetical protein